MIKQNFIKLTNILFADNTHINKAILDPRLWVGVLGCVYIEMVSVTLYHISNCFSMRAFIISQGLF